VLGWDSKDTVLHLEAVARELTEQLSWPADESDVDAWRTKWRAAFTVGHQEVIATSKALSIRLAQLARDIRDRISTALTIETEDGPLTKLMKAFQESLIHDLSPDDFADMYAQTIAYGLLSSRIADPKKKSIDDFSLHMRLSPFLKELMETFLQAGGRQKSTGLDFDELGVGEVVHLLDQANMEAVVADFGDKNPQEDPVIHFYELFLKEYDAKKRTQRGVFYTPRPVVAYIVRSVDEVLRSQFGLDDGLADTTTWGEMLERNSDLKIPEGATPDQDFVQVLDPATGTGTFLVEVIDVIFSTLDSKWRAQNLSAGNRNKLWNSYVNDHLLDRLYGYEIMMASYAIAHLKIAVKLLETGYSFSNSGRAHIYLTNSLDPAQVSEGQFSFAVPELAREAAAVSLVKRHPRFTVVVGNPPYSGVSSNMGEYARQQVENYKIVDGQKLEEKKTWLQDDYVKFMRLAQMQIEHSGTGIVGMITNRSYVDNPTFRGMRQSLMSTFPLIAISDLHGSATQAGRPDNVGRDVNVFEIKQGVAVIVAASIPSIRSKLYYSEIWGERETKYDVLLSIPPSLGAQLILAPNSPYYFFVPRDEAHRSEYETFIPLKVLFPEMSSGIVTAHDRFAVAFEKSEIIARMARYVDLSKTDTEISHDFGLRDNYHWKVTKSRAKVIAEGVQKSQIEPITYRPFDARYTYYNPAVVFNMRLDIMRHLMHPTNMALVVCRQSALDGWRHVFVARGLVESCLVSNRTREIGYVIPRLLFSGDGLFEPEDTKQDNVSRPQFIDASVDAGMDLIAAETIQASAIFPYAYAILHSATYRSKYSEFLKVNFPSIPGARNLELFHTLAGFGSELVSAHLMEQNSRVHSTAQYFGSENIVVNAPVWESGTVFINNSKTAGFSGISEEVWDFQIGSYQVCHKWLKDRRERTLSQNDISHYVNVVHAITETVRIMKMIDQAIDEFGGWPDAFQRSSKMVSR
jgi:predicted helicase